MSNSIQLEVNSGKENELELYTGSTIINYVQIILKTPASIKITQEITNIIN